MFYGTDCKVRRTNVKGDGTVTHSEGNIPTPYCFKGRKNQISALVSAFTRSKYSSVLDQELRQNRSEQSNISDDMVVQKVQISEESSRLSRQEIKEKNIINSLKTTKYG